MTHENKSSPIHEQTSATISTELPLVDDELKTVIADASFPGLHDALTLQPTIEVISGSANRKVFALGPEKLRIGRVNYNDVVLNDGKVSRTHAAIYFEKGYYVVEDLNSTNGIYVDGNLVHKVVLRSGSQITIGDTVLLFTQVDPVVTLEDKISFINKTDLFNWLDDETKALLAENFLVRFFPKDSVVLRQKAPVESMYFLYSGSIRVVEINEEGGERAIDEIKPGGFFGERGLLAGEAGLYSMVTNADLHLLELRRDRLNELLLKKPELNKAFYRMMLQKLTAGQTEHDQGGLRRDQLQQMIAPTDVTIIGEDKKIKEAKKRLEALARENASVLIVGRAGTGKRTFARYYHKMGTQPDTPYVELSLAELDRNKIGAAIFGVEADPTATHMKGQIGYLEMVGTGTLAILHAELLDAHQQSKLATYLQQGWFHRMYGRESVRSKTQVILVATGAESEIMERLIPELQDLYKNSKISLPTLTQRLKDIPLLAEHYLALFARKSGKRVTELSREATEKLVSYNWPGDVKELENVLQRATIVSSEDVIIPGDLIFVVPSEKERHRYNLLRSDTFRNLLRHPLVPKLFVWFNIFMVVVMAGFTLFGGSKPEGDPLQSFENNPGMLITWLVWFPILPISALLLGRIWCGVCPIAGIGDLVAKIKRFNFPAPKILKRLDFWTVAIAFMVLDFSEEFFAVAEKPWATGMLLVIIISLSAIFCVLFERKTFCRYVCPLAGMLGTYAPLSMMEVRGNKKVCQTQCGQHLCYKGTEHAEGCPMFSYPASLSTNAECMMCFNCLKSCDNRGVQINIRPPLQELWHQSQPLLSLSVFGVIMVGLMGRHQFTHLAFWKGIEQSLNWPEVMTHTVVYSGFILAAFIPFWLASTVSAAASQEKVSENMAHYGMAFIPLAITGHISHVADEWLGEGIYNLLGYFVKLYQSLVAGIPIGSQPFEMTHFIHESVIGFIKFMTVSGGMLASLVALVMIARHWSERNVMGRILPHLLVLLAFWCAYLFIFLGATGGGEAAATAHGPAASQAETTGMAPASVPGPRQSLQSEQQTPAASPPVASSGPRSGQAGSPVATANIALLVPDLKGSTYTRLDQPNVAKWLQSARSVPGSKQARLPIQGEVTGAPSGAKVRASLESGGALTTQFTGALDSNGRFSGDIVVNNVQQRIPLVLELLDPKTNTVTTTHRVVLY
ncbi:MAG: sigma 54-interacting transcriptional regulator [Syntrophobacteraceae bacterium]